MTQNHEPLSDERLAEIRQTAHEAGWMYAESANEAYGLHNELFELLAEVERLREREAALMAVAREVAAIEQRQYHYDRSTPYDLMISALTIAQARALLASEQPDAPGRE